MYTLEQCLEQQKKVDASITHTGTYMPWLAAIGEVIEMCDHLSLISTWKKQPEADMKQAFMELVDVFAFAMSDAIHTDYDVTNNIEIGYIHIGSSLQCLTEALGRSDFDYAFGAIKPICKEYFNRPITDIYYYYMGKQTLTRFRQVNGYKNGSYIKMWGGREDNEYLTDALESGIEIDKLSDHLKNTYNDLVIAKAVTEYYECMQADKASNDDGTS